MVRDLALFMRLSISSPSGSPTGELVNAVLRTADPEKPASCGLS
jgi:hypothetical protein